MAVADGRGINWDDLARLLLKGRTAPWRSRLGRAGRGYSSRSVIAGSMRAMYTAGISGASLERLKAYPV
jgi:hypothetical protein